MKIMFICLSLSGGGTERVIANLTKYLSKNNKVEIIKILNKKDDYKINENIKMFVVDGNKQRKTFFSQKIAKISLKRILTLKKIILTEKPDIILCFLPLPSLYTMLLKRFNHKIKKIPVILSERGDPTAVFSNGLLKWLMKNLYNKSDGFVFQTKDAEEYYKNILNCKREIIGNPINEQFIKNKPSNYRKKTIVTAGRLENQKNHKLLIDAYEKIINIYGDYKLLIYGEGSLKNELLNYINQKKLENKVILMGRCNCLYNELYDAGMFVLSSDFEGLPNSLLEALAMGLPTISTDCPVGGPKMVIENNKNGILIEVKNQSQLEMAMKKIIEDKEFANFLSNNAIVSVKKYYPEIINKKWEEFILEVYNYSKNNENK